MKRRVIAFVSAICAIALGVVAVLTLTQPPAPPQSLVALGCMIGWGLIAQTLGEKVGRSFMGSIASIPYLAAIFLVPRVEAVLAIGAAEGLVALSRRSAPLKSLFNIAQTSSAAGLTALVFLGLGGSPMLAGVPLSLSAYVAAVAVFFVVNTFCVGAVIAISERRPIMAVWHANTKGSVVSYFLATPLPALFAALFASKGVFGAVLLAIPLIAIRQVFRTAWQLEAATQDLLQLMVKAIEARDPYTSGHSQRVQEYAGIIARTLGLSVRLQERLSRAALLHDVGKIHEIYAPILRKPEKLTPAEWALMKTHPIKSAELIAIVSHLRDIVPSVRHHHENWDGSGYPDRLQGPHIPQFARIIAIADTIDAMTTDRPYRRALDALTVRDEIQRMAGSQFDPDICRTILTEQNFQKLAACIGVHTSEFKGHAEGVLRAS